MEGVYEFQLQGTYEIMGTKLCLGKKK